MIYRNFMLTNSPHIASLRYSKIKRRISEGEKFVELIASIVNLIYCQDENELFFFKNMITKQEFFNNFFVKNLNLCINVQNIIIL